MFGLIRFMGLIFNVGGTFAKALFGTYLRTIAFKPPSDPEVSVTLKELRIRDPITEAEYLFIGETLGLDPITFRIEYAQEYAPPKITPPLKVLGRKVMFGTVHESKKINDLVGEIVHILEPRDHLNSLKALKGSIYYRRRFGNARRKFEYDMRFRIEEFKVDVKFLSARFIRRPEVGDKIRLKKAFNVDVIVAFDANKDLLVIMDRRGDTAIVRDLIELNVEYPSIAGYLRELLRERKYLVYDILSNAREKAKKF